MLISCYKGKAQLQKNSENENKQNPTTKNMFIEIGCNYSNYQDLKFSKVQYSGIGSNFSLGYNKKSTKHFWEVAMNINFSKEKASTHNSGKSTVINPSIYFKYLKPLNKNFLIGSRIDLIDFYYRDTKGLGNNSNYYINGSHLYASLIYNKKINENWNLQSSLDLGLLSFMKESTSFAFSAPQNALEDGEFSYQNEKLESHFGFKYFEFKNITNNINLKTNFLFQYKKHFAIGYSWNIRHFANVKSYPLTTGIHSISFRYNFVKK